MGTVRAMGLLCRAQLLVGFVPLRRWSGSLGLADGGEHGDSEARKLAAMVERAAERLPFHTKCLPRAMALSWILRSKNVAHSVVIAVRPQQQRHSNDALHAWINVGSTKVLGDLPGPWIETLRLGHS